MQPQVEESNIEPPKTEIEDVQEAPVADETPKKRSRRPNRGASKASRRTKKSGEVSEE